MTMGAIKSFAQTVLTVGVILAASAAGTLVLIGVENVIEGLIRWARGD